MEDDIRIENLCHRLRHGIGSINTVRLLGRVVEAVGTIIKVSGMSAKIGDICLLQGLADGFELHAEVVGFSGELTLLSPMGDTRGLSNGVSALSLNRPHQIDVGDHLLGTVLNGMGRPINNQIGDAAANLRSVNADPPDPLERQMIDTALSVGIRAIDGFITCGVGQRIGVFAPAGCGKSTLLGMIARNAKSDVNVIALIGERGREVQEFMHDCLGPEGLRRSVLVVATSDRSSLERAKAALVATTIAEYFRDQGKNVTLMLDSVTRYARALREIGLASGEPPTRRAFPPSVFSALPQLFERAGNGSKGSITGFYTVLEEGEDGNDPISEEVRSLLDGHIVLSRKLAAQGHYPAIDVLNSVSRVMSRIGSKQHQSDANTGRSLLARYLDLELLIRMGEYKNGSDKESDAAIAAHPRLLDFLRQDVNQKSAIGDTLKKLSGIAQG